MGFVFWMSSYTLVFYEFMLVFMFTKASLFYKPYFYKLTLISNTLLN